jgi:copper(I)-binding protein
MKLLKMIAACLLLTACVKPVPENPLDFADAWVRPIPPGSMMTAGFGRLVNNSEADMEISSYSSPQFGDVSLHRTVVEDGLSRMKEVPVLSIPSGSEVELNPGGYHLMLMKPLGETSETVEISMALANGQRFIFELPIERR